jgi:hypothetical protein
MERDASEWAGAPQYYETHIAPLLHDRRRNTRLLVEGLLRQLGPNWSRIAFDKFLEQIEKDTVNRPSAYFVSVCQEKLEIARKKA